MVFGIWAIQSFKRAICAQGSFGIIVSSCVEILVLLASSKHVATIADFFLFFFFCVRNDMSYPTDDAKLLEQFFDTMTYAFVGAFSNCCKTMKVSKGANQWCQPDLSLMPKFL